MYSLLLMTAMAGGGDAPSFGGRLLGGCHGCQGAVASYSCYGSSCNGCWGSSCHGCHGGFGFLGIRNVIHNVAARRAAHGCHGSCYGGGCYGSCHGCMGSSSGGCWGSSSQGCWGSSSQGCWGASSFASGCQGYAGSVVGGVSYHEGAVIVMPAVGTAKIEQEEKNQSASLTVELPAGAKLYVDGKLVPGDATARRFHTPELARGKKYFYEMKAEITVGGKPVVEERTVLVRAGDALTERFEKLATATAGATGIASR